MLRLSEFVEPPKVVQQLDWVSQYWPRRQSDDDDDDGEARWKKVKDEQSDASSKDDRSVC